MALLNVSDWRAAQAAVSSPPCAPTLRCFGTALTCPCSQGMMQLAMPHAKAHRQLLCSAGTVSGPLTLSSAERVPGGSLSGACQAKGKATFSGCRQSTSRLHRRDALGIDTIEIDIWTTLVPPNGFTAATVWAGAAPPDVRVFDRTAQFGVPLNVTLVCATTYLVRAACWLHPNECGFCRQSSGCRCIFVAD